ncbi:MAG TPA: protein kinase [Planctomycetota bacterium]|nr:protein kinase [Planctomycetota bacterium]
MAEIQDSEFLRILRSNPIVPQDEVLSAQELQRGELDREGSCRSLFAILRDKGLIDDRIAETMGDRPGDVTPHTPTVVLNNPDHTPAPGRGSSSGISKIRTSRRHPPEVDTARIDPRNVLGSYILVKEVGKGGMGRVYRAWDENVGRFVAVKVIDTEDVTDRERFVREAQIAGRLNHPSIATVYQAGEQGTRGYIAMQFIEGGPIDAVKLPLLNCLALIRDAARALSYAHEQGVIHRDVKPGNLMVDNGGRVFLTDFGLAKEVVGSVDAQLSITGTTFGTPQYMSPEQARGEHKKIDGRCDVYSLGATLYALLARRPPFTSTNLATLLLEVLDKRPPPLSKFNSEISPELQMLVEKAMAKEPPRRYGTMTAFADALDELIREGRYAGRYGLAKALARRWVPRLLVAAALGAVLWFGIPIVFAPPKPVVVDPTPALYADAASALRTLENQALTPEERRERVEQQVLQPLKAVLDRKPQDLRARALRLRAHYARGDGDAAERELRELEPRKREDYRILLVPALRKLEASLAAPCPLPAFEGPGFEWEEAPVPPASGIDEVVRAKIPPDLAKDYEEDRAAIDGLSMLAQGQFGKAADLLRKKALPVYQAAWCRAAYLDRRFKDVIEAKESEGRRERFGAAFALAEGTASRLESLLPFAGVHAPSVHSAMARMEGTEKIEQHAEEGRKGAGTERRAALASASLRLQALRGSDDEAAWRAAVALAGESPSTSQGKLAAVELRIGLGSRLLRTRGEGRPALEDALRRAEDLLQTSPDWAAPRLLCAVARLRLGRLEDARADLGKLTATARSGLRARLTAASVELASAERERRAGAPFVDFVRSARREALSAPGESPEAQTLAAAASLLLAQDAAVSGRDESEPVASADEALSKALQLEPEYVEALYHRSRARFLKAELARRSGADGRGDGELSLADADAALKRSPEFQSARYLRGIVNFSLGRDAEAVADWRLLIQSDASWDTPDVRSWIQRAEARQKK